MDSADKGKETTPARAKIGLDANLPIDPKTGAIRPQVADPEVIASTGTGWVRLNFVLGPWSGPGDATAHGGGRTPERTWAETYGRIVAGFRAKGLSVYGLVGCEAMPRDPGDRFRAPPAHGEVEDEWLAQYVQHFVAIVELFHREVQAFESFNEPDDWHGQKRNWIHPAWFAVMLQRICRAARAKPELEGVTLVSGPLQGLQANNNAAALYLHDVYRAGKKWFGWGQRGVPFPFDGVGYHIYLKHAPAADVPAQERSVRATYRRYLSAMERVIAQEEGGEKPLYVSEMGWSSAADYREVQRWELFQARLLRVGLEAVAGDPAVALGCWFCTQDFGSPPHGANYGLYRAGTPVPENRKASFYTFRAVCEGEMPPPTAAEPARLANQDVIDAFAQAAVELGLAGRWSLLAKAGLSLGELTADRQAPYEGPAIDDLPNLTAAERAAVKAHLPAAAAVSAEFGMTAGSRPWERLAGAEGQAGEELKAGRERAARLAAELEEARSLRSAWRRLWPAAVGIALLAAVVGVAAGALLF